MKTVETTSSVRALALTTRLVLGYMLVALLTLTAAAVFLHEMLHHGFEVEDAELISDHVRILRHEMQTHPGDLHEVREVISSTAAYRSLEKYYGVLLDEKGTHLVETPGFAEISPPRDEYPAPVGVNENIRSVIRSRSPAGLPLFLTSAMIEQPNGAPPLKYLVALDITHVDEWLGKLKVQLIIVVASGTLISGILAWVLTNTGLKPLREITSSMQRVGAQGLDERLGSNRWPDELAAMAGEFDNMLERLHGAFQRLSQFSADAAHEFRTPLNNLMVSTSFLLSRDHENEEYKQALAANLDEFERLKRMVDSLLFLARADNAEAHIKKTQINASELTVDVVDFFSALAEERDVSLIGEGTGVIVADETLIRMALTNLISNSLKHTSGGGQIRLSIIQQKNEVVITVSDTGIGIAAKHLPRLFDRFYRLDAARTHLAADSGAGLGLALVKTVAALHGGHVDAQSEEGKGTTMRIILPLQVE